MDLIHATNKVLGIVMVQGSCDCVDNEMLKFRILRAERRLKTKLDLGKQTLVSSKIILEESYGIRPWREEAPKKAGCHLKTTSSKLKSSPSQ